MIHMLVFRDVPEEIWYLVVLIGYTWPFVQGQAQTIVTNAIGRIYIYIYMGTPLYGVPLVSLHLGINR